MSGSTATRTSGDGSAPDVAEGRVAGRGAGRSTPVRSDARRNRAKLLAAAAEAFAGQDAAEASLESIARAAGVGIGTLYRNFPTRADLIEAVYRNEVELLAAGVDGLLAGNPPDVALAAWLNHFIDFVTIKRGMITAMRQVVAADTEVFAYCHGLAEEAMTRLVGAAVDAGTIRPDTDPSDLMRAMIGVCSTGDDLGWQERASRLIGLIVDGLRYRAPARTQGG